MPGKKGRATDYLEPFPCDQKAAGTSQRLSVKEETLGDDRPQ